MGSLPTWKPCRAKTSEKGFRQEKSHVYWCTPRSNHRTDNETTADQLKFFSKPYSKSWCHAFLGPAIGETLFTKSVFFFPRNFPNAQSTFRVSQQKRPGWFWQLGHLWAWPRWPKLRGCTALDITQHDPAACVERLLPFLEMDTARPQGCWLLTWFTWVIFNRSVGNSLPNLHICNWFICVEKCASPNKFLASVAGLMACGLIALGIRKPLSYTEIA